MLLLSVDFLPTCKANRFSLWSVIVRWFIVVIGLLATIGFIGVSGWMNFRFGVSLGKEPLDGHVFGVASVCADGMKAILPFVIVGAWRVIRPIVLVTSIGLWMLCSAYSLTSSLGFAASNRAEVTDARRLEASKLGELSIAFNRKQTQREHFGRQRDPSAIANDIAAHQQHRRWQSTKQCERATVSLSRRYCERYFELQSEHATALMAHRLDVEIDRLRERLQDWKGSTGRSVDPQVSIIDQMVGLGEDRVTLAITILLSLMLEVGSGLGCFLVLSRSRSEDRQPSVVPPRTVELLPAEAAQGEPTNWLRERLRSDRLASVALWEAYQDYSNWSELNRYRDTRTLTEFETWLRDEIGLCVKQVGGQQQVVGVSLVASA